LPNGLNGKYIENLKIKIKGYSTKTSKILPSKILEGKKNYGGWRMPQEVEAMKDAG